MNHFICEGSDVPYVAINILTVHMAIVLVSFVNLIYFFISGFRIEKILSRVSASSLRAGELLSSNLDTDLSHKEQMVVPSNAYKVMADESGYVTHFRLQNLASLAEKMDVCIRYRHQIGDFVTTGTVLCYVWDAQTRKDEERVWRKRWMFAFDIAIRLARLSPLVPFYATSGTPKQEKMKSGKVS
jgi:uncharacterized membrane protein